MSLSKLLLQLDFIVFCQLEAPICGFLEGTCLRHSVFASVALRLLVKAKNV